MSYKPVRVLSKVIANQIAAGEVVERPASVVKELVENAIDAQAQRVEVEVFSGGAKRICIHDNGTGMTREDAINSLERQATSKIQTVTDISTISTLGFRGEAIPSIASVSRFTLKTRMADAETATELHVVGGVLEDVNDTGTPIGTTVEVCDLFFNLPVRKKFLKSATTELARIKALMVQIAMANPSIGFVLQADNREVYRLPEGDTPIDRIAALLGEDLAQCLVPIAYTYRDITLNGFTAPLGSSCGATGEQYVFINGRPATAPIIQYALREAIPSQEGNRKPVVILFITLPPAEIDVNVHPTKREVRFRNTTDIVTAIISAFAQVYRRGGAENVAIEVGIPSVETQPVETPPDPPNWTRATPVVVPTPPYLNPIAPMPTPQRPKPVQESLPSFPPATHYPGATQFPLSAPSTHPSISLPSDSDVITTAPSASTDDAEDDAFASTNVNTNLWRWYKLVSILDDGYLLITTDTGFVTVDSRAAMERVVYERLSADYASPQPTQSLLIPETVRLSPVDADRVRRFMGELHALGFTVSELTTDTFMLETIPPLIGDIPAGLLLTTLAEDLAHTGIKKGKLDHWREETAARAAAQAAAGTAKKHTELTANALIQALALSRMPYTSPRGKPTMILTTYRELNRRFQRM